MCLRQQRLATAETDRANGRRLWGDTCCGLGLAQFSGRDVASGPWYTRETLRGERSTTAREQVAVTGTRQELPGWCGNR